MVPSIPYLLEATDWEHPQLVSECDHHPSSSFTIVGRGMERVGNCIRVIIMKGTVSHDDWWKYSMPWMNQDPIRIISSYVLSVVTLGLRKVTKLLHLLRNNND